MKSQSPTQHKPAVQDIAMIQPKNVATPFPPANLKKIGNKWPKKAASAVRAMPIELSPYHTAAMTGRNPLSRSPNKTITAAFLPPIRKIFVAPGFFEPCVLGSGRPKILHIMMALEKEPIR